MLEAQDIENYNDAKIGIDLIDGGARESPHICIRLPPELWGETSKEYEGLLYRFDLADLLDWRLNDREENAPETLIYLIQVLERKTEQLKALYNANKR